MVRLNVRDGRILDKPPRRRNIRFSHFSPGSGHSRSDQIGLTARTRGISRAAPFGLVFLPEQSNLTPLP